MVRNESVVDSLYADLQILSLHAKRQSENLMIKCDKEINHRLRRAYGSLASRIKRRYLGRIICTFSRLDSSVMRGNGVNGVRNGVLGVTPRG